jgi:mono/diheme cytochrome c family protein
MKASYLLAAAATLAAIVTTQAAVRPPADVPSGLQADRASATAPGSGVYYQYCANCHGESGKGDGPVAPHLRKPPTDLTRLTLKNNGVFPADRLALVIDGRETPRAHSSDMPSWGDAFMKSASGGSEGEVKAKIRDLVKYIETIQERPPGTEKP